MKSTARNGIRLGLVAALLITGVGVGVNALTASGGSSQEVIGELRLTVPGGSGRTGTVQFFPVQGSGFAATPSATQNISATAACPTLEFTGDALLDITAEPGIAVLPNNGLGVTDNTNCGSSAAIVQGEGLRLGLLNGFFGGNVDVRDGTLEIFRDNGGGNLQVGQSLDSLTPVAPNLSNGLNTRAIGGFTDSLLVSSTSTNSNKGLYLRGATFTLVRDIPNAAPTADFTFLADGLAVDFTDASDDPDGKTTITSWTWDFDGAFTSELPDQTTAQNPKITYSAAGSYEVELTVTDNRGATATRTRTVIANRAPTADFTFLADGLAVAFTDTSDDPDGKTTIASWAWDFDGEFTSDPGVPDQTQVQNPTITYTTPGEYQVKLTVTDNRGATAEQTKTVEVFEKAVFCSREVIESGNGDVATATFLRGENGDKFQEQPCVDVGVVVDVVSDDPDLGDYVFWDNSFKGIDGSDQDVKGLVTIKWAPIEPSDPAGVAGMNNRGIDYDGFANGINLKPQSWCLSFDETFTAGVNGEPDTWEFDAVLPDWPYEDEPGFILVGGLKKVPWCLVSDTRIVDADGNLVQTEVLFGSGDPLKKSF